MVMLGFYDAGSQEYGQNKVEELNFGKRARMHPLVPDPAIVIVGPPLGLLTVFLVAFHAQSHDNQHQEAPHVTDPFIHSHRP